MSEMTTPAPDGRPDRPAGVMRQRLLLLGLLVVLIGGLGFAVVVGADDPPHSGSAELDDPADVDPVALEVTRENARRNGVAARLRTVLSDVWRPAPLRAPARFDLATAHILPALLLAVAPGLARGLPPRGVR